MSNPRRCAEDRVDLARRLDGAHAITFCVVLLVPTGLGGAQNLTPLATASGEYCASATSRHTGTEAMRLRTLPGVRLVCPLHCSSSVRPGWSWGKARRLYAGASRSVKPTDLTRRKTSITTLSENANPRVEPANVCSAWRFRW